MASKVYFASIDRIKYRGIVLQIDSLFEEVGFASIIEKNDNVAVKIHTGDEYCNCSMLPSYIRRVVENVKKLGGNPFVADACQLYKMAKFTSHGLVESAATNGFSFSTMKCPVIPADGFGITFKDPMKCEDMILSVPDGGWLRENYFASAFVNADAMVVCARISPEPDRRCILKHVGMGCASKRGKAIIHEATKPVINSDDCDGCGSCAEHCAWNAVQLNGKKAKIDYRKCVGCGICAAACRTGGGGGMAERRLVRKDGGILKQKGIVDSAAALIRQKQGKIGYLGFLIDYRDDCENWTKRSIFPDIGILASKDPVALDAAGYHLISKAPFLPWSAAEGLPPDADRINSWPRYRPDMYDWELQLSEAERLGLGTRKYELIEIDPAGSRYDYHGMGGWATPR